MKLHSFRQQIAFAVLLCTGSCGFAQDWLNSALGPSVVQIRAAAEKGEAAAQYILGSAYYIHGDPTNALVWYKKSARQGNADAQYGVGGIMVGSSLGWVKSKSEGMRWVLLAANQNLAKAEVLAGQLYEYGNVIAADKIEAFKWYSLAANQQPPFKAHVDVITLKMTTEEIAEGQKRVAAFQPMPPAPVDPELKLQGISGKGAKKLAMINGHTFAAGETAKVKAEEETLSIKCLEIADNSVSIQVNGGAQKTLTMR